MTTSGVRGSASHDLLCRPPVSICSRASRASDRGWTVPVGWLPALIAAHPGGARWLKVASARIERHELPVQRNRTFMVQVAYDAEGPGARQLEDSAVCLGTQHALAGRSTGTVHAPWSRTGVSSP